MFCPNCGNQIKDNVKFCPKCGTSVRQPSGKPPQKGGKKVGIIILLLVLVLAAGVGTFYYVNQQKEAVAQEKEVELRRKKREEKKKKTEEEGERSKAAETTNPGGAETTAAAAGTTAPAATEAPGSITASLLYSSQADFNGLSKIVIQKGNVTQSSFVVQTGNKIDNTGWSAFDGNAETSWQEGQADDGIGEYVTARFDREYQVKNITFLVGNHRTKEWFIKNNRPKKLSILLGGQRYEVDFPDEMAEFTVVLSEAVPSSEITIMIDDVYLGTQYHDTVIAEVGVYGN